MAAESEERVCMCVYEHARVGMSCCVCEGVIAAEWACMYVDM